MRTEDDVREALRQREGEAASAEDVLPRLLVTTPRLRHGRGRSYGLAVAASAAVVGVVVATLLAGAPGNRSATPASPTSTGTSSVSMTRGPRFEFSFQMGHLPPAYRVLQQGIDPGFQWADIECPNCRPWPSTTLGQVAGVFVFDRGKFNPSVMKDPTLVDVNGARGLAADILPVSDVVKRIVGVLFSKPPRLSTIAWQYAPQSWALVAWYNTDSGARESALSIARSVTIGGTHPALLPFTIDYLPSVVDRRWQLISGTIGGVVTFGNAATTYSRDWALPIAVTSMPLRTGVLPVPGDMPRSLTVGGRAALYFPKQAALFVTCGSKCTLSVGYWAGAQRMPDGPRIAQFARSLSEAELVKIAEHITVARSLTDTSTWFDAAYAVPH